MPITPPPDKKQEQPSYSTDPVGPDLDKDALVRLYEKYPLKDMVASIDEHFPGMIDEVFSNAAEAVAKKCEEAAGLDSEKDIPLFKSSLSFPEMVEKFNQDFFGSR